MCRNPEYKDLMNEKVYKAMNKLEELKDKEQISQEDYRIIMPILDASFDPNEK